MRPRRLPRRLPSSPWAVGAATRWALLLAAAGGALWLAAPARAQGQAALPFDVLLGRPTDRSIALSLLATADREVVVDAGTQSGSYPLQSPPVVLAAGTPEVVTLESLQADTTYYYRVRHRAPGTGEYAAAPEATFVTQRAAGRTFTFAVEADPHHQDNEPLVWRTALANILADRPDFLIDLGDTFMDEKVGATTLDQIVQIRKDVRAGFFGLIGQAVPLFLVNGNHDPELGWLLNRAQPQANLPAWGVQGRQRYYPCPVPSGFYSGAAAADAFTLAPRDAYYAFTWGDALFIALDPFWYSSQATNKSKDPWFWTLGQAQYDWLQRTLEGSRATFKFVFLHHLVGGSHDAIARGGIEYAPYYEWGGSNLDGTPGFASHRPGWARPIEDLLLAHNVSIVFHGHDHLYVKQDLDADGDGVADLIYQEVPQPSRSQQGISSAVPYGYRRGMIYPSSGHLRVRVSATQVTVDYVRAVIPGDTSAGVANGAVSYRYTIQARGESGAPRITVPPLGQGVRAGGTATFAVTAEGAPPLAYQWQLDGRPLAGATTATLTVAGVTAADQGAYRVSVSNAAGSILSAPALLTLGTSRLTNLSVRTVAGTGDNTLLVGVVVGGAGTSGPKPLLVRAVGPTLGSYGVGGALADPRLELIPQGAAAAFATNDNWGGDPQVAAVGGAVGAFPLRDPASQDAALVAAPAGGVYAVKVDGVGGTTGIALAEVYDASGSDPAAATPRLVNLSARAPVGTGDAVLIAGFVLEGTAPRTVLIRAVGPTLASYGVTGALADPRLELGRTAGGATELIASNDNWAGDATVGLVGHAVGAFGLASATSRDAALVVTLPPGVYYAKVSGVDGSVGVALIELYEVP